MGTKGYWKKRARQAEREINNACELARELSGEAYNLRCQIAELTRELEDKRKNWAPIKIKHPYVPRDAKCVYCDDSAADPRHENVIAGFPDRE